ncbi:MAG TPA: RlpA-like double-psi beta-barrel domain-containing protein [Solirubrobacteraceae bacterium]
MPGRRTTVLIAITALLVGGGGAYAYVAQHDSGGHSQLRAEKDAALAPVLVPRRRRPPQVVEPVAGDVNGASDLPGAAEIPSAPPPKNAGPDAGPSSGAPSDAEVRAELSKLQVASRKYHFDQLDFSNQLLPAGSLPSGGWQQSIASVFYDYGLPIACGGVLHPNQLGVAHKSLPCGTMVTFRYGRRAIRVPVIDRGPYIAGRVWDFTGATAAALGFPGLGTVEWHL